MKLIIIESPFAGEVEQNIEYARVALKDSLMRGEAPLASHLLYPQVLDDLIPSERTQGINAGLAWRAVATGAAFYIDRGWSSGMIATRDLYDRENIPYVERSLHA